MQFKICNKCKYKKSLNKFYKDRSKSDGLRSTCKKCDRITKSSIPKESIPDNSKRCKKCKIVKLRSEFHSKSDKKNPSAVEAVCKECRNKTSFRLLKPTREDHKICYQCNTEKPLYEFNKLKRNKTGYYSSCRNCYNVRNTKYVNNKLCTDPSSRLKKNLRQRVRTVLNGQSKSISTMNLLGCSLSELKSYLQSTADRNGYKGFDINDYSGREYHIDHVKPCSSFDLTDHEQQKECFHWSNLQILSAKDNLKKSDKY